MKKILFFAALGALGTAMFTSCSNDDAVGVDKVNAYESNFQKVFGKVNQNHTFNAVNSVTLEASLATPKSDTYSVKVYDADPLTAGASLLGDFKNLNSRVTSQLKFDVSQGAKKLFFVVDNGGAKTKYSAAVPAKNGKVVAKFASTPTVYPESLKDAINLNFSEDYAQFTKKFYDNIPAALGSLQGLFTEGTNHSQYANDFLLEADEEGFVTLYPIFINETSEDYVGYYVVNPAGGIASTGNIFNPTIKYRDFDNEDYEVVGYQFGDYLKKFDVEEGATPYPNLNPNGLSISADEYVLSKPIKIQIGVGNRLGLTITNTDFRSDMNGEVYYSEKSRNPKQTPVAVYAKVETSQSTTGETEVVTNESSLGVVGLEDLVGSQSDNDMNDIVFYTENVATSSKPLEQRNSVTIAFEDLGADDDFDFNDVVLTLDYAAVNPDEEVMTIRVNLECAGGVLPAHVYYRGEEQPVDLFGEIHEAFDQAPGTIINTGFTSTSNITGVNGLDPISTEITVPADFSIDFASVQANGSPFFIIVDNVDNGQNRIEISTTAGAVPQAMVLGKTYYVGSANQSLSTPLTWQWPIERTDVVVAYPNITNWISNPADYSWLTSGVSSLLYTK